MNTVIYDITSHCNLKCKHCYNSKYLDGTTEIEIDIKKVVSKIVEIKPEVLLIQGGEPLLVKNLELLIKTIKKYRIKVYITTNATLLTEYRAISLLKSGISGFFFSIESSEAKKNNLIRGKGSFEKAIFNIEKFIDIYDMAIRKKIINEILLCFSVTITPLNIHGLSDINNMFLLAKKYKVNDLSFAFMIESGNGIALSNYKEISNIDIAGMIVEISKKFPEIRVRIPYKKLMFDYLKMKYGRIDNVWGEKSTCPAGSKIVYLNKNLDIHPCGYVNKFDMSKQIIQETVIKSTKTFSINNFDKFIRIKTDIDKNSNIFCKKCEYFEECIKICPYDYECGERNINVSECVELKKRMSKMRGENEYSLSTIN